LLIGLIALELKLKIFFIGLIAIKLNMIILLIGLTAIWLNNKIPYCFFLYGAGWEGWGGGVVANFSKFTHTHNETNHQAITQNTNEQRKPMI
jgi:hypothetical protein